MSTFCKAQIHCRLKGDECACPKSHTGGWDTGFRHLHFIQGSSEAAFFLSLIKDKGDEGK